MLGRLETIYSKPTFISRLYKQLDTRCIFQRFPRAVAGSRPEVIEYVFGVAVYSTRLKAPVDANKETNE